MDVHVTIDVASLHDMPRRPGELVTAAVHVGSDRAGGSVLRGYVWRHLTPTIAVIGRPST